MGDQDRYMPLQPSETGTPQMRVRYVESLLQKLWTSLPPRLDQMDRGRGGERGVGGSPGMQFGLVTR